MSAIVILITLALHKRLKIIEPMFSAACKFKNCISNIVHILGYMKLVSILVQHVCACNKYVVCAYVETDRVNLLFKQKFNHASSVQGLKSFLNLINNDTQ